MLVCRVMTSSSQWGASCNFFDCILECISFLSSAEQDEHMMKEDVLDSMRSRMYFMMGKMMSHPLCTSMSMQGWCKDVSDDPAAFDDGHAEQASEDAARQRAAAAQKQRVALQEQRVKQRKGSPFHKSKRRTGKPALCAGKGASAVGGVVRDASAAGDVMHRASARNRLRKVLHAERRMRILSFFS